jgi:carbon storage regulator
VLVLTRKVGQRLQIGDAVVRVLGVDGGKVKVGIEAPASVQVTRGEAVVKAAQQRGGPVAPPPGRRESE